jgi:hypothetical protein
MAKIEDMKLVVRAVDEQFVADTDRIRALTDLLKQLDSSGPLALRENRFGLTKDCYRQISAILNPPHIVLPPAGEPVVTDQQDTVVTGTAEVKEQIESALDEASLPANVPPPLSTEMTLSP